MIIVAGTITFLPSVIPALQRDVAAMVGQVRKEKGCRHYSLLVEDAEAGLLNVLEEWDDDAALITHLGQPWIVDFFNRYSPHLQASTVRICDVSAERPLPGM
jgi:quinol monooxygenase YgiN